MAYAAAIGETPSGWGTIKVDVDHKIETQEDIQEVTKQIAYLNIKEDGTFRYTTVAILKDGIELLEANGFEYDSDPDAVLFPSDFKSDRGAGIMLGDDEHFAFWGHDITDEEAADTVIKYLTEDDVFDIGFTAPDLRTAILSRGVQRVLARRIPTDDDELVVTWSHVADASETFYPVTLVDLR